jgi:hypothetical protein
MISRVRDMTGIDPPLNIVTAIIGSFKVAVGTL